MISPDPENQEHQPYLTGKPLVRLALTLSLCVFGVLGNQLSVPLFFGVDFVFGSIAALTAVALLGPVAGVTVAAVAGAYTFLLWGHPYAAIVFVGEAIFVSAVRRHISHLALADAAFWLLFGVPAVIGLYWSILNLPHPISTMIALKQAVNGVFNGAIAAFVVIGYNALRNRSAGISLASTLFNSLLVSILVPGIILITLETRQAKSDLEQSAAETLRIVGAFTAYRVRDQASYDSSQPALDNQFALQDMIDQMPFGNLVSVAFLNEKEEVLAQAGRVYSPTGGQRVTLEDGVNAWLPPRGNQSVMAWWGGAYYIHLEPVNYIGPIAAVLVEYAATPVVVSLHKRNLRAFLILIILTTFSIIVAILVSNAFAVPLIDLGLASRNLASDIESGKSISVPDSRLLEVKTLATSFRTMAVSLNSNFKTVAERTSQLESLSGQLSKYLSPQIYNSIFSGRQDAQIRTKRKKLTVCFTDIKDFTAISSDLQPEDLTYLLNSYFTEMSKIAIEHGATLDKFIGDAMVIFFGDPETKGVSEDARACVRMALAMQLRMQDLADHWLAKGLQHTLKMRIGINTGYCDVGNFGSKDHMDYTIIGAEVNIAARLENLAEAGGILLSNETYMLVKDLVDAQEAEPTTIKGVKRQVRAFAVRNILEGGDKERRIYRHEDNGLYVYLDADHLNEEGRENARIHLERALEKLKTTPGSSDRD